MNCKKKNVKTILNIGIIIIFAFIVTCKMPTNPEKLKVYSLIPAIVLISYILFSKRVIEGLIIAVLTGIIMISRPETVGSGSWIKNVFSKFSDLLLKTMLDEDIAWVIIVCGLMGGIIALIEKSGGAHAFGEWAAKKAKTQKQTLLCAWLLGILIFIDDYLDSLTVGACTTKLTDKFRIPREYLAYVVGSTAAPVCSLVPLSTWSVFVAKLLEKSHWAPEGQGMKYFIKTIPYNFYAWFAILIVPLVIWGVIPIIGPMKKAIERVEKGGLTAPQGSKKMDIHLDGIDQNENKAKVFNLVIPLVVLIGSTILLGTSMQQGVIVTLGFMFVFYLAQGIMTAEEFVDVCIEGIKNMVLPLVLVILAFLFARVNNEIHFTDYIIMNITNSVSSRMLPLAVFITLSITEFITGSNWGMYVIALPIVIPLAQNLNANTTSVVAAVLSAGVFGAHICFYSDATIMTSASTGCDSMSHSLTQLPFGLIAAGISIIMFGISGMFLK